MYPTNTLLHTVLLLVILTFGLLALSCDDRVRPSDTELDEPETEPQPVAYEYLRIQPAVDVLIDAIGVRNAQGEEYWGEEVYWLGSKDEPQKFDAALGSPDAFIDWPWNWSWCVFEHSVWLAQPGMIVKLSAGAREGDSILLIEVGDCVYMTDWGGSGMWETGTILLRPFSLSIGPSPEPDSGQWLPLEVDVGEGPFHRFVVPALVEQAD